MEGLERRGNLKGGMTGGGDGEGGGRDGREKRWREKKGIRGRDEREGGKGELFEGGDWEKIQGGRDFREG